MKVRFLLYDTEQLKEGCVKELTEVERHEPLDSFDEGFTTFDAEVDKASDIKIIAGGRTKTPNEVIKLKDCNYVLNYKYTIL